MLDISALIRGAQETDIIRTLGVGKNNGNNLSFAGLMLQYSATASTAGGKVSGSINQNRRTLSQEQDYNDVLFNSFVFNRTVYDNTPNDMEVDNALALSKPVVQDELKALLTRIIGEEESGVFLRIFDKIVRNTEADGTRKNSSSEQISSVNRRDAVNHPAVVEFSDSLLSAGAFTSVAGGKPEKSAESGLKLENPTTERGVASSAQVKTNETASAAQNVPLNVSGADMTAEGMAEIDDSAFSSELREASAVADSALGSSWVRESSDETADTLNIFDYSLENSKIAETTKTSPENQKTPGIYDVSFGKQNAEGALDVPLGKQNAEGVLDVPLGKQNAEGVLDVPLGDQNAEGALDVPLGKQNAEGALDVPLGDQNAKGALDASLGDQKPAEVPDTSFGNQKIEGVLNASLGDQKPPGALDASFENQNADGSLEVSFVNQKSDGVLDASFESSKTEETVNTYSANTDTIDMTAASVDPLKASSASEKTAAPVDTYKTSEVPVVTTDNTEAADKNDSTVKLTQPSFDMPETEVKSSFVREILSNFGADTETHIANSEIKYPTTPAELLEFIDALISEQDENISFVKLPQNTEYTSVKEMLLNLKASVSEYLQNEANYTAEQNPSYVDTESVKLDSLTAPKPLAAEREPAENITAFENAGKPITRIDEAADYFTEDSGGFSESDEGFGGGLYRAVESVESSADSAEGFEITLKSAAPSYTKGTEGEDTAKNQKLSESLKAIQGAITPQTQQAPPVMPDEPEVTTVSRSSVFEQIHEGIAQARQNPSSGLEIKLNPEFLGKMSITLSSGPDGLSAQIKVTNTQAHEILAGNITALQNSIRSMGITMSSVEVTYAGIGQNLENGSRRNGTQQNGGGDSGRNEKLARAMRMSRTQSAASYAAAPNLYTEPQTAIDFKA